MVKSDFRKFFGSWRVIPRRGLPLNINFASLPILKSSKRLKERTKDRTVSCFFETYLRASKTPLFVFLIVCWFGVLGDAIKKSFPVNLLTDKIRRPQNTTLRFLLFSFLRCLTRGGGALRISSGGFHNCFYVLRVGNHRKWVREYLVNWMLCRQPVKKSLNSTFVQKSTLVKLWSHQWQIFFFWWSGGRTKYRFFFFRIFWKTNIWEHQ